jgi:UTP15 C terminal
MKYSLRSSIISRLECIVAIGLLTRAYSTALFACCCCFCEDGVVECSALVLKLSIQDDRVHVPYTHYCNLNQYISCVLALIVDKQLPYNTQALDSALKTRNPLVVVTVLDELNRRSGLTQALTGRGTSILTVTCYLHYSSSIY